MGEVLAIGPGRQSELDPSKLITVRSCKVGDIVLVPKIGTLRIDFEGDEYYITQDREVIAVIKTTENKIIFCNPDLDDGFIFGDADLIIENEILDIKGLGNYDTFTHIDIRDEKARW